MNPQRVALFARVAADDVDLEIHHLVRHGSSAYPYLARQLSTEYRWQSIEGYPTMVDLSVGVRVIRNRMVTQGAETTI